MDPIQHLQQPLFTPAEFMLVAMPISFLGAIALLAVCILF